MKHKIIEYKQEYMNYLHQIRTQAQAQAQTQNNIASTSASAATTTVNELNLDYKLLYLQERMLKEIYRWRFFECKRDNKKDKLILNNKLKHCINPVDPDFDNSIAKFVVEICKKIIKKGDTIPSIIIKQIPDEKEAMKKWHEILKSIILGFTFLETTYNYKVELSQENIDKVDKALQLFIEHYQNLWL